MTLATKSRWSIWASLYLLAVLLAVGSILLIAKNQSVIESDFNMLLPQDQTIGDTQKNAEKLLDQSFNRQMILLVGANDRAVAFQVAERLAESWRESGLFDEVNSRILPDIQALQNDAEYLQLAILPQKQAEQIIRTPSDYFQQRAKDLINPFVPVPIMSQEKDWLGFGRFISNKIQPTSRLTWDSQTGMLFAQEENTVWVWVHAMLPKNSAISGVDTQLLSLLAQTKNTARQWHVQTRMAGAAIFAAENKKSAEKESQIMSVLGIFLTLGLLLSIFRSARILSLLLPVVGGVVLGFAVCLWWFGQVHILTLVIGSSLVGVLIDFPVHWLSLALWPKTWHWQMSLRKVTPIFFLGLVVTITGYAALWLTPLPVLQQTAIFSIVALVGAFLGTISLMPFFLQTWQPKPMRLLVSFTEWLYTSVQQSWRMIYGIILIIFILILLMGLRLSNWQDDIRQWANLPDKWLQESADIGKITGILPAGQFFLIEAKDEEALLQQNRKLDRHLSQLQESKMLDGFQTISSWVLPQSEQKQIQKALKKISSQPENWADMQRLGVPKQYIENAMMQMSNMDTLSISESLDSDLARAWQPLWLGKTNENTVSSVVFLRGIHNIAEVQLAGKDIAGVHWVDRPARLNMLFAQTRNLAIQWKMWSYLIALVLLLLFLHWQKAFLVLFVPLLAAMGTIAVFGWLGIPISLFAILGLLLVSAIGVDYAVYAVFASNDAPQRLAGILLAALTTIISFSILSFSSTPAVSAFGLSVTIGVLLSLILTAGLLMFGKEKYAKK